MDYARHARLLKVHQGLFTRIVLVGLGSIVAGGLVAATGCLAVPVLTGFSNFFAGMTGNNLGTLVERFRNSGEILRNEDIAKAVGRTVAKALMEKVSRQYPEIKGNLDNFADQIEGYWLKSAEQAKTLYLFESLQEEQLYKIFAQQPENFTEYQVLLPEEWREVVI